MSRIVKTPERPKEVVRHIREFPLPLVFFLVFFFYVWFRIQPALEYEHFGTLFFFGQSFFAQFRGRPGGLLEYATAFLAQLNHYSWLGALVVAGLGIALFLSTRGFFRAISGSSGTVLPLLITLPLLFLRGRYDRHSLVLTTGIVAALTLTAAWTVLRARVLPGRNWVAAALGVVLTSVLFYAAGLWPCVLFSLLTGLLEIFRGRRAPSGVICVLAGAGALGGTILLRGADVDNILNPWGKRLALLVSGCVYLYLPVCAGFLCLLAERRRKRAAAGSVSSKATARGVHKIELAAQHVGAGLGRVVGAIAVLVLGWVGVWIGFDGRSKAIAEIHFDAIHNRWEELIESARQVPREDMDPATEMRLHLALYQTGRLCEELFAFRNQTTWEVLPGLGVGAEACRAQSHVLLKLGLVNDAEHFAHEALEYEGEDPELLRLLAEINVLKGRPRAARVFLCALNRVPFQRKWSQTRLECLRADSAWPNEDELSAVRYQMLTNDLPHNAMVTEGLLRQLLRHSRGNKMAYEYLVVHYLLNLQLNRIVDMLGGSETSAIRAFPGIWKRPFC